MLNFLSPVAQIVLGLLGLSFLVFIHELGHFLFAKKFGVRVKVFSVGFGKKLLVWKRGETEYCLSAIPFGGYVAMAGENPDDQSDEPAPDDFVAQPIRARAAIAFGGPAVNIVFAFLTLVCLYMVGVEEPVHDKLVVGFVEDNSPGAVQGIVPGDTILSVSGKKADGWDRFREDVGISLGAPIQLTLHSAQGDSREVTVVPQEFRDLGIGWVGIHPRHRVLVATEPRAETPAARAGLHEGDTILSINGLHVASHLDVIEPVNASKGKPLDLEILRGADTLHFSLQAEYQKDEDRYMVGIQLGFLALNEKVLVRRGIVDAFVKAGEKSWQLSTSIFRYIGRLIQGQVKVKALSGPIGIVPIIGMSWMESFHSLMMMLALISINLGVMNLLPLAITDGGILMFLALEAVRGRPLARKWQAMVQQLATALFVGLFLYLTFQDLSRFSLFLR